MLKALIAEAAALGGGNLCAAGHEWESEGGRTCPKYEDADCSQTVYVCKRCGVYDYGDKGGPAHRECFSECRRDFAEEIAENAESRAQADARYAEATSNALAQGRDACGASLAATGCAADGEK